MHPNLSFEQAPPIAVPFRFFLTAPLFGVLAGGLLAVLGEDMLASRWTPGALAATHLLVAGFMLQTMCGALLQFIPVAAGGNIWRPRWVAGFVHPLSLAAALLLAAAFLTQHPPLFILAALAFALSLGGFIVVVGHALWRTAALGATLGALRMALAGLAITLALGVTLALGLAGAVPVPLPLLSLTDLHAAWGLGGWALLLLVGVSFFVVPMFQLTPAYPGWFARGLPRALGVVLLCWTLQSAGFLAGLSGLTLLAGWLLAASYALVTLRLQARRRRKVADTTLWFFRLAMVSLLAGGAGALAAWLEPGAGGAFEPRLPVWQGLLVIAGGFVSAMAGMLYKIMPFLSWLHLQRLGGLHTPPPLMNQMLPDKWARGHLHAHLAGLLLLLLSVWLPVLARAAGLVFAFACAWLAFNLAVVTRNYLVFKDRIRATA